jgi:hypothetical protein
MGQKEMAMNDKNRIMIYGRRLMAAAGEALAISTPKPKRQ